MYQLVSAIVKPLDANGRWRSMDIGTVRLDDLYKGFRRVIATLSNKVLTANVSLDIEQLRAQLGGSSLTFNEWLIQNGSKTLPTSNDLPVIRTRYAQFSDAVRAGYHVTPTHPTISASSPLPISDRTDLLVTKKGVDYEFIHKRAIANVNGFYHLTDWSSEGIYVVDGMKSCLISGRNELGLLSFMQLGTIDLIPIQPDMIYTLREDQKLRYNCYVDTRVDLSQKTVFLVLGGYLHAVDPRVFFRVSASAFGIDFSQIPLVDRFYESHGVLDLSHLGLETTPANPNQVGINNLYSDAVLMKYLTMSQSFFIALDNQDIFVDYIDLHKSPFPGCYTSFTQPVYPMVVGRGRHAVYWPRKETDRFSVNIRQSWGAKPVYETVPTLKQNSVSDSQLPLDGYRNSDATFLLIGSDI